ncbi:MAG: cellulase family glycosylhydrolase [Candidatus Omnitrophica bacterium]|nr:cellulase family glycosylhydrolase [Candidatus Omnitrophota bacterium]
MKPQDRPPKDSGQVRLARQDSPYGVLEFLCWDHGWNNRHYPSRASIDRSIELMKKCGVGMVRMDFLWQDIEAVAGAYRFEKYDYIVDALTRSNIAMLGVLGYHTDWASPDKKWNVPSPDHSFFTNYCRRVCRRYKDRVKFWEIWNEPDSKIYWEPQDGLTEYVPLLRDAYTCLKQEDPGCSVLNGGLAEGLPSVNALYAKGGRDCFDILNIHAFESPIKKDAIESVVSFVKAAGGVMDRYGDTKKRIWVTEIGCPGVKAGMPVEDSWLGENPSELQQASWVTQIFHEVLGLDRVDKAFWAFFRDTDDHWKNGVDYFGLIRNDFSLKPAYRAYRESALL